MRLLIFSDIHNDRRSLERLMEIDADYYFAAGDLVSWARGLDQIGPILSRKAEKVYVIPGNHESTGDITRLCSQFGLNDFHGGRFEANGHWVAGLGYSSPTPFNTPGEYSEAELARRLSAFEALEPLIMICHCPPFETPLDQVRPGLHAGSTAVKAFIDAAQPRHFFCGHIHEAEGVRVQMGATTAVNVGKKGYLLEL
jgi:Icc-related predicted phosphoesterase